VIDLVPEITFPQGIYIVNFPVNLTAKILTLSEGAYLIFMDIAYLDSVQTVFLQSNSTLLFWNGSTVRFRSVSFTGPEHSQVSFLSGSYTTVTGDMVFNVPSSFEGHMQLNQSNLTYTMPSYHNGFTELFDSSMNFTVAEAIGSTIFANESSFSTPLLSTGSQISVGSGVVVLNGTEMDVIMTLNPLAPPTEHRRNRGMDQEPLLKIHVCGSMMSVGPIPRGSTVFIDTACTYHRSFDSQYCSISSQKTQNKVIVHTEGRLEFTNVTSKSKPALFSGAIERETDGKIIVHQSQTIDEAYTVTLAIFIAQTTHCNLWYFNEAWEVKGCLEGRHCLLYTEWNPSVNGNCKLIFKMGDSESDSGLMWLLIVLGIPIIICCVYIPCDRLRQRRRANHSEDKSALTHRTGSSLLTSMIEMEVPELASDHVSIHDNREA